MKKNNYEIDTYTFNPLKETNLFLHGAHWYVKIISADELGKKILYYVLIFIAGAMTYQLISCLSLLIE